MLSGNRTDVMSYIKMRLINWPSGRVFTQLASIAQQMKPWKSSTSRISNLADGRPLQQ